MEGCFSNWRPAASDVPSYLYILMRMYCRCMISKFADDINIGGVVESEDDLVRLQHNLDQPGK